MSWHAPAPLTFDMVSSTTTTIIGDCAPVAQEAGVKENDKKYNGWTNYETWCVNLWITNEQSSDSYWMDRASEILEDCLGGPDVQDGLDQARFDLADELKEHFNSTMPELGCTVWSDLMTTSLQEVDWDEIAQHYVEDAWEARKAEGE